MTEAKALAKNLNLSAQKMRLIANLIRPMPIEQAFDVLSFSTKKAAPIMRKILQSAVSNAENNHNLDLDDLTIKSIQVNEGPTLKRWRARAKGRGARILKRTCHVEVIVSHQE